MYALIVLAGGNHVGALLLSASAEEFRVVIPGRPDTTELRLIEGQWISDSGEHIELGALLSADAANVEWVIGNTRPRALSAH